MTYKWANDNSPSTPIDRDNPMFRFLPPRGKYVVVSTSEDGDDWTFPDTFETREEAVAFIEKFRSDVERRPAGYGFEWMAFSVWKADYTRVDTPARPLRVGDFGDD